MAKTISKTFRLTVRAVEAMEQLVDAGKAVSQTALLEALVSREKARLDLQREEQELDAAWQVAMQSSEYRAELDETLAVFAEADAESARAIR